ncbi:glutamate synthase-related protein [Streptomyces pseudovenezuelae]|uniref:glutamate synthase-related protein n=1 Tax=Streptomyces pseudovenezuelae TaxID=67350 RepID=UPI0039A5744D
MRSGERQLQPHGGVAPTTRQGHGSLPPVPDGGRGPAAGGAPAGSAGHRVGTMSARDHTRERAGLDGGRAHLCCRSGHRCLSMKALYTPPAETCPIAGPRHLPSSERCGPTVTATEPNSRAADPVRSGKVDDPTGENERFRSSEPCKGGAGGTRTHGRRIMSPLRILAALAFASRSVVFSQVRWDDLCRHSPAFVSLFLSLRPQRVPNASRMDDFTGHEAHPASSEPVPEPTRNGLTFQRTEAHAAEAGRSSAVRGAARSGPLRTQVSRAKRYSPRWPATTSSSASPQAHECASTGEPGAIRRNRHGLLRDNIGVPTIPRPPAPAVISTPPEPAPDRDRRASPPAGHGQALALGADALGLSNVPLQAIGCVGMRACRTDNCPMGIATQQPHLRARLLVQRAAEQLTRYFESATTHQLQPRRRRPRRRHLRGSHPMSSRARACATTARSMPSLLRVPSYVLVRLSITAVCRSPLTVSETRPLGGGPERGASAARRCGMPALGWDVEHRQHGSG